MHKPQLPGAVTLGQHAAPPAGHASSAHSTTASSDVRSSRAVNRRFGRLVLFVLLLLTSAVAMKFTALVTRAKDFHPNGPARSTDADSMHAHGD